MLWTTADLADALDARFPVTDEASVHLTPAQHDHINFYGTYDFDLDTELQREGHRPLPRTGLSETREHENNQIVPLLSRPKADPLGVELAGGCGVRDNRRTVPVSVVAAPVLYTAPKSADLVSWAETSEVSRADMERDLALHTVRIPATPQQTPGALPPPRRLSMGANPLWCTAQPEPVCRLHLTRCTAPSAPTFTFSEYTLMVVVFVLGPKKALSVVTWTDPDFSALAYSA